eukprot:GHVR01169153.1.p1 GENE.GHVR01169153.1~~GHVR01169153.1.p1  ORF type:complete len:100 (+),score=2.65 GHVR01169153.1:334-633(+)
MNIFSRKNVKSTEISAIIMSVQPANNNYSSLMKDSQQTAQVMKNHKAKLYEIQKNDLAPTSSREVDVNVNVKDNKMATPNYSGKTEETTHQSQKFQIGR